jgi:hypothetical protein
MKAIAGQPDFALGSVHAGDPRGSSRLDLIGTDVLPVLRRESESMVAA